MFCLDNVVSWYETWKRTPINLGCFRAGSLCSTEWDNKVSICTYRCIGAIKRSFTFFLFFASPLWCVRRSLQLPSAKKCTLLIDFSSSSLFSFIHTLTFTGEGSSAAVVTEDDGIHFLSFLLSPFLNFYPNLNPILINYLSFFLASPFPRFSIRRLQSNHKSYNFLPSILTFGPPVARWR